MANISPSFFSDMPFTYFEYITVYYSQLTQVLSKYERRHGAACLNK